MLRNVVYSWDGGEDGCPLFDPVAVAACSLWGSDPDGSMSYALHVVNFVKCMLIGNKKAPKAYLWSVLVFRA